MPRTRKSTTTSSTSSTPAKTAAKEPETKTEKSAFVLPIFLKMLKIYFSLAFYIIWVVIGLFVLLVVVQGFRRGAYAGLLSSADQSSQDQTQPTDQSQQPTTADLPGIGQVDIACVQQALSPDALQKVLQAKSDSVLSASDKAKFDACITAPESATPSASAGATGQ